MALSPTFLGAGIPAQPPGGIAGPQSPGLAMPPPAPSAPVQTAPPSPEEEALPEFDTTIKLTEAERTDLGKKIVDKVRNSQQHFQERYERIRSFRDQYESKSVPKLTPWPNAASLNIPTTRSITDTVHAHVYRAMVGTAPLFRVEASGMNDTDTARKIEQILQWQMIEQIDMPAVWDPLIKSSLIDGIRIALTGWRKEAQRTRKPGHVRDENGQTKLGVDGQPIRALVEETEFWINQPSVEDIDFLDFCVYPANALSIDAAQLVGHRIWKTANDLRKGVRDGLYDKEFVDAVIKSAAQPDTGAEMYGGDSNKDAETGIQSADPLDPEDRAFELFQVVQLYDADGDGIQEDCLFVVEMSQSVIIRAEVFPYWHNERPYHAFVPIPREGSFIGYSLPEILESLHAEINAIRNQRVDAGTLVLSPVLAARRTVKFDFNRQRWRPGAVLYMDDPKGDVAPISFQAGGIQQAFSEEQFAREQAEKVTGASDYAQGASPSRSRTLGEVSSVLSEGNMKFDLIISRLHRQNNRIASQVIALDRQYLPASQEFALTRSGERVFETLTRDEIRARVRIQAQGNTLNSNKELLLQMWETLFQMSRQDPLMQKPTRQYAINAGYIQAMGVSNPVPYIGTEEEARLLEQQAENAPPPPPPPPQLAGKLDEPATLALMLKEGQITMPQYIAAAQVSTQYAGAKASAENVPKPVQGDTARSNIAAKTHDAALRVVEAEHQAQIERDNAAHAASIGTAHGLIQQAGQQALTPPPFPASQNGASASPVPAAGQSPGG